MTDKALKEAYMKRILMVRTLEELFQLVKDTSAHMTQFRMGWIHGFTTYDDGLFAIHHVPSMNSLGFTIIHEGTQYTCVGVSIPCSTAVIIQSVSHSPKERNIRYERW